MFGCFCGLDSVHILSVFRHDHAVVFVCLDPYGHRVALTDVDVL